MVRRARFHFVVRCCALSILCVVCCARGAWPQGAIFGLPPNDVAGAPIDLDANPYTSTVVQPCVPPAGQPYPTTGAQSPPWMAPSGAPPQALAPVSYPGDPSWGVPVIPQGPEVPWTWQILPKSIIYHSYEAGLHEPRLGIIAEHEEQSGHSFWDGTAGGRVGLLRYGTPDGIMPQGFEADVEAAALVRLTLDSVGDFETADYRYGVPLTYGIDNWQFKLAAYHLSSHLGDEFAIAHPGSLADRINYVRNELVLGASYFPQPFIRVYGEVGWCFECDGGAEPWETQFGIELSKPGATGPNGSPFLAINTNLREEQNWGGDFTVETGWLWRNETAQTVRVGFHYFNGKSSQFQTFNQFEQQVGAGLWYDF